MKQSGMKILREKAQVSREGDPRGIVPETKIWFGHWSLCLMVYQPFLEYLMPKPFSKKNSCVTIQRIAGRMRGSYLSQGYLPESEWNSTNGVWTRLLRFRRSLF